MTACCGRPRSRACARTSRRAKWCAKRRRGRRPPADGAAAGGAQIAARRLPREARKATMPQRNGGKAGQASGDGRRRSPDPSRSRLLGRCRRHQGGSGRILRQRVGLDGAARCRPAAGAGALPGRHRGRDAFSRSISPRNIKDSPLRHVVDAKEHDVIAVEKLDDLIALVQSGALEIHVRGSRLDSLELATASCSISIRAKAWPGRTIVAAAREMRERLKRKSSKASPSSPAAKASMS